MKPIEAVAVCLLVIAAAILLWQTNEANDRVSPSQLPSSEESETAWYYVRPTDTLEVLAITFYGHARYTNALMRANQEKGVIENSSLPSGIWLYIPGAVQHLELLGHPVGEDYEP